MLDRFDGFEFVIKYKPAEFEFVIKYKPGKHNAGADALSRTINIISVADGCPVFKETLLKEYENEKLIQTIRSLNANDQNGEGNQEYSVKAGLLYKNGKLVIRGESLKQQLMKEAHEIPISGHLGIQKTFNSFNKYATWPNMMTEISEFITQCETSKNQNKQLETSRTSYTTGNTSCTMGSNNDGLYHSSSENRARIRFHLNNRGSIHKTPHYRTYKGNCNSSRCCQTRIRPNVSISWIANKNNHRSRSQIR